MTRFVAHVHKELRDQRAVLIAVFAALPVLMLLAFWGLTDHLLEADVGDAAAIVVPIGLALYLLAMAGDAFAGDARRKTVDFLRRQPGGLAHAYLAKVALTAVGLVAVFLWQAALLQASWSLWGRTFLPTYGEVVGGALFSPFTIGAALLASWILLTSTWLRQGGIALLLAPMIAAALALPGYLWFEAHPVLARFVLHRVDGILWLLLCLSALLPLLAAAWSWLGGRRVVRSAWSAAWRGLAAVLVLSGAAYAGSAVWIGGQLELTPASSDLFIAGGRVSPDEGRLYLTVLGDGHRAATDYRSPLRTPRRTWTVDLATGRWSPLGDWGETISSPPLQGIRYDYAAYDASLVPLPMVVQYRRSPEGGQRLAVWVHADSGDVQKVVQADVRTRDVTAWIDEAGRIATAVRDPEGRRVWLPSSGTTMHVGDDGGSSRSVPLTDRFHAYHSVPGGWYGWDVRSQTQSVLDASTGEIYRSPFDPHKHVLGPRRVFTSEALPKERRSRFVLLDPKTGEQTPARNTPTEPVSVLCAVDTTTLLIRTGEAPHRLLLWNPVDGTSKSLTPSGPSVDDVWHQGMDADGRLAFSIRRNDLWDVVLLDPRTQELSVRAQGRVARPRLIALFSDGTTYGIEDGKRVCRYGPGPDEVEVVFPR